MRFDENLGQFVYEYEGIVFAWDEEPGEDFPDTVKKLAAGYYERLDDIVRHIAPEQQVIMKGLMTSSGILPPI